MTDRAKKISELQATTTVANTDKLVVLKDPSGTPLTRSVTINAFAQSVKGLFAPHVPNSSFVSNTLVITSDGTNYVNSISYSLNDADGAEIMIHANDDDNVTIGRAWVVANTSFANAYVDMVQIGSNPIVWDGTVVISGTNVILKCTRQFASTANVTIKYHMTIM